MLRSPLAKRFVLAPNVEPRRGAPSPDMIILHYTGMASCAAAEAQLCSAQSGVSCHYLIDQDGTIVQMVGEEMRAWHAGISSWMGDDDCNSRSIGIEIHNRGHTIVYDDFPVAQMQAVAALCHDIRRRHDVPQHRILAHSDVAPARKIDPGEKFDWGWLHRQGLGHWVPPAVELGEDAIAANEVSSRVADLQLQLQRYGYGVPQSGTYDPPTATVVSAFQRHFRTARVDGVADAGTRDTLRRLVAALS